MERMSEQGVVRLEFSGAVGADRARLEAAWRAAVIEAGYMPEGDVKVDGVHVDEGIVVVSGRVIRAAS